MVLKARITRVVAVEGAETGAPLVLDIYTKRYPDEYPKSGGWVLTEETHTFLCSDWLALAQRLSDFADDIAQKY